MTDVAPMTLDAVLNRIGAEGIQLRNRGGELGVSATREQLDPELLAALRAHKAELLERVGSGEEWWTPPSIRPEMLPLVSLTQAQIDGIVATVPGGAANVQDIYPLAPLQEGFLFHYLLASEGDPYLLRTLNGFPSRERLDAYLDALRAVIARHDILRTAIVWEDVPEPVQVVWRQAPLVVEEVELDPAAGDAAGELYRRFDPRHHRIDLRQAPLMRCYVARDAAEGRWVLLQLRHHLVGDHTTQEMMREEVEAHLQGRADSLPRPLPFRNYIAQTRLGVSAEEHRAFFTEMLGDVHEPTAPFGLLDVRGDGSDMEEARLPVEERLAARLRERARALGVSTASVIHLAWAQVLARLSGRDDVVFGTMLFGRTQGGEGSERVMGPSINMLPIRIRVGDIGAEASLRRTHALLAELLRHEHASLALAQRCSAVDAPAPLFTAPLNYRHGGRKDRPNAPAGAAAGGARKQGEERTNYPLTLTVDDLGDGFGIRGQVTHESLDPMVICAFMHRALEGLVEALETAPDRPLGSIDVLPESERSRVLEEWNRTDAAYPAESCIHELFERQAERSPDAEALVFGNERLGYGELNARANRLAHHLRSLRVGPDVRVAICVDRSPEMVMALLAVLKAGGAYVPLDPTYPAERLDFMLADSAPAAVLTQTHLRDRFESTGVPVLELDASDQPWASEAETDPERGALTPEHLAYVIYTSGSTGRPKGVLVPHRGLSNVAAAQQRAFGVGAGDRVLQFASLSFDAATFEVIMALSSGAALCLAPREELLPGPGLVALLRRHAVTLVTLPPSALAALPVEDLPALRTITVAGEALPAELAERWGARHRLWNLYGPTEATIWSTAAELTDPARKPDIGGPIANVRAYVLDEGLEPHPVGVAGELYVGGAGVARGYLGRPALTAERFVPDPFGGEAGARLYRTGDRVRRLPDGRLDFIGRVDHQVKVRGFRIELGEVEARLAEHPDVREAVVVAREDAGGGKRLVAYVVGDEAAGAEVLRAHLGETLPEYMVPAAYVRLDALPLTPNGKLDRGALPAPEGDAHARGAYEAPVGATEETLAGLWAEVLGIERVGRRDDFFDLGGHSILAMQVTSRVQQALGADIEVAHIFSHPTVASLAAHLGGAEREARSEGAIALRPSGSRPPLFLVHEGAGSTAYAQVLHPHVDPDVPVYALPAPPLSESPLRTVEGMATRLVGMIREVQPAGPYRVAGWSFGGVLAYEIATQLLGQDETVEFVGMMDTYHPAAAASGAPGGTHEHSFLLHVLRMADLTAAGRPLDADEESAAAGEEDLETFVARCREKGLLPAHVTVAQAREMRDRLRAHRSALAEYVPLPLPISVHLFPARQSSTADPSRGWRALLPERLLQVTPVPGTHLSMMEPPNAEALGRALSERIGQARGSGKIVPGKGDSPALMLQGGKPGVAPLFCVPGAGSGVTSFMELSMSVDPSWPVHGLQPRGMDGATVPHATVPAAAEYYLRAVREMCPEGPVHLLGHSFGGWVALEMALRLREAGRTVGSLTILDSEVPRFEGPEECDSQEAFLKLVDVLELTAERSFGIGPAEVAARDEAGRLKLLHQKLVQYGIMHGRSTYEVLYGPFWSFSRCVRTSYRPSGVYPDRLRLVLVDDPRLDAEANRQMFAEVVRGWTRWAPGLEFSTGAGNHITALKSPHVATLAAFLAEDRK